MWFSSFELLQSSSFIHRNAYDVNQNRICVKKGGGLAGGGGVVCEGLFFHVNFQLMGWEFRRHESHSKGDQPVAFAVRNIAPSRNQTITLLAASVALQRALLPHICCH
jgi:hypothetical protein